MLGASASCLISGGADAFRVWREKRLLKDLARFWARCSSLRPLPAGVGVMGEAARKLTGGDAGKGVEASEAFRTLLPSLSAGTCSTASLSGAGSGESSARGALISSGSTPSGEEDKVISSREGSISRKTNSSVLLPFWVVWRG